MTKIDKQAEIKKNIEENNRVASERKNLIKIRDVEESYSSSSMAMYSIDSNWEDSKVPSRRYPTLIEAQIPKNQEEVHSSPTTDKIPSERHSVIEEEENPTKLLQSKLTLNYLARGIY